MVASNFERALSLVLKSEGGYVNDARDPGGATNLGVTIGTARRYGVDVDGDGDTDIIDIKKLKPADAAKVYRPHYWDAVRGDQLPPGLDYAVFDFAVNSGPGRAIPMLQAVLGVAADGNLGPTTLAAAGRADIATAINGLCNRRLAWLKRLKTWGTFGKGWTSRVESVRKNALAMAAQPATHDMPVIPTGPAPAAPKPQPAPPAPQGQNNAPVTAPESFWQRVKAFIVWLGKIGA